MAIEITVGCMAELEKPEEGLRWVTDSPEHHGLFLIGKH